MKASLSLGVICFFLVHHVQSFSSLSNSRSGPTGRQMIFELETKIYCMFEPLSAGMELVLDIDTYPAGTRGTPLQLRLTSPSTEFSDWASGDGNAHMRQNITETGDYEICFYSPQQMKVTFSMFFHDPKQLIQQLEKHQELKDSHKAIDTVIGGLFQQLYKIKYSIRYYNQIVSRDELIQEKNSNNIQLFSVSFVVAAIIMAILNVILIRRMFKINTSRIRI